MTDPESPDHTLLTPDLHRDAHDKKSPNPLKEFPS